MKYSKIVLVNPPSPPGYVSNKDSMGGFGQLFPVGATYFPPLDLVYLASSLSEKGCSIEVVECLGSELPKETLIESLGSFEKQNETVLCVVRTSTPTLDYDLAICDEAKTQYPNLNFAIYGPVVPTVIKRIEKEQNLDYIISGDPDEVVFQLVSDFPMEDIKGLKFRLSGAWAGNSDRAVIRDLDQLPYPKWELFPYQKYKLPKSSTSAEHAFLPMLTSRGCPIGCHYCPYPVGQGLAWRYRSPENVVGEIDRLVSGLGIKYIVFRDPMFSLNQKRVIEICRRIVELGLKFQWRCETRVDFLNEETLTAMASAGCDGINFGIESSDVEIQKNSGRKEISKEQFIAAFNLCRKLGIKTFGFFIIGLPGDTVETVLETIKFAIDLRLNWVQFTAASPFVGTKLRDWAVEKGFVKEDEYAYISSHEALIGNENLTTEQVRSLHRFAQILQNYLLNRKGILKDDNRTSWVYRGAKTAVDAASNTIARGMFSGMSLWYQRTYQPQAHTRTV